MTAPFAAGTILDVPSLRARLERRFRVYDVQSDENVVAFFVDAQSGTLETEFEGLKRELKEIGLVPLLKYQGGEHAIYVLRNPTRKKQGWKLNLVLFLATIATTTAGGTISAFIYYNSAFDTSEMTQLQYFQQMFQPAHIGLGFLTFALPLLLILTIHELGHFFAARRHGIDASYPFFIPVPPLGGLGIGTFGAFIAMREPMPSRKALFDVGASGPIAGFIVAIPVLLVGFALMALSPVLADPSGEGSISLGTPLLFDALALPFGLPENALLHPTAFAGWVGLLVTAMNLLPAGQLDGGHIAAAMFGERAKYAGYGAVFGLLALGTAPWFGFLGYEGWLIFALLIGLMGIRHAPTLNGVSGLDPRRQLVGWITFGIGVVCFTLIPLGV